MEIFQEIRILRKKFRQIETFLFQGGKVTPQKVTPYPELGGVQLLYFKWEPLFLLQIRTLF